jgi:hypothetical protein
LDTYSAPVAGGFIFTDVCVLRDLARLPVVRTEEDGERISMKLTVDWSEFVGAAMRCLRSEHPELELGPPQFKKDYGSYESIGDMYDFPTFIEMEIK